MKKQLTVKMAYNKSTVNTHVYKNDADGAAIPTLYVKKASFKPDDTPENITVIIEYDIDD